MKKKSAAGIFFGTMLRAFVIIAALVIIGLGYVLTKQIIASRSKAGNGSDKNSSVLSDNQRDELLTATTEAKTEEDSESEDDGAKDAIKGLEGVPIVVLNGTDTPGLAGEWAEKLKKKGFTNVQTGNYFHEEEMPYTKIYAKNGSAESLKALFNDSEAIKGMIDQGETDIVLSDDQTVIVIGAKDNILGE